MQQLKVELTIPIPAESVIISKVELEELKKNRLQGVYWNMQDLEKRTNKKQAWLKENILYVPKFKVLLDVENGGFVYYPNKRGEKWSFLASEMANFLDKNFYLIFGDK
ncbi:DUF771 domain-containing protein [Sporosarcina sp. FSL W7-1283]|uniref:DUF771 domain-containing protein n=1 Tax=Sporosarcina sp. FSL W7-1283 TaxID=2921560 RepID=UPI0030F4CFC4